MQLVSNVYCRRTVPFWRTRRPTREFTVWGTIKLGTHRTVIALLDGILARRNNSLILPDAADLLKHPECVLAQRETEVDLVEVSVGELGFPMGTTIDQFYARAQELGLRLCLPEIGLQLLYQNPERPPNGVMTWVAMEPIPSVGGGHGGIFVVMGGEGSGWWLLPSREDPADVLDPRLCFFFVLPRKRGLSRLAHVVLQHLQSTLRRFLRSPSGGARGVLSYTSVAAAPRKAEPERPGHVAIPRFVLKFPVLLNNLNEFRHDLLLLLRRKLRKQTY